MKKLKTITLLLLVTLGTTVSGQNKKINIEKSTIKWVGTKITGSEHSGNLKFQEGLLIFKGKDVTGGNFTVNMSSLNVTDLTGESKGNLEGHLKADDFFGTEKFKTATLKFTKIASKGKGIYTVVADLTIKGITKPETFELNVNDNIAAAKLMIDRTKYNIKYGSKSFFQDLGDKVINDEFELNIKLSF